MKTILDQIIELNRQYQDLFIRLQIALNKANDNLYNRNIPNTNINNNSLVKTDCLETTDSCKDNDKP